MATPFSHPSPESLEATVFERNDRQAVEAYLQALNERGQAVSAAVFRGIVDRCRDTIGSLVRNAPPVGVQVGRTETENRSVSFEQDGNAYTVLRQDAAYQGEHKRTTLTAKTADKTFGMVITNFPRGTTEISVRSGENILSAKNVEGIPVSEEFQKQHPSLEDVLENAGKISTHLLDILDAHERRWRQQLAQR